MKKILLLTGSLFTFCLVFQVHAQSGSPAIGITVAGGNGNGTALNQVTPHSITVDASQNLYVLDEYNNRVLKFAPETNQGIVVAGGNGGGAALNQINFAYGIALDAATNLYVADYGNHRITKWSPGATAGVVVTEPAATSGFPRAVSVDASGNVYSLDLYNSRVLKYAPGVTTGVTIVTSGGMGTFNQPTNFAENFFIDATGNIYIVDKFLGRILKWTPGSQFSTIVAGGNGNGAAANQLNSPNGVFVDAAGNLYIADENNARIQKWVPGASAGTTVAGGNGVGSAADQLSAPANVFVDRSGRIFVADEGNNRVQVFDSQNPPGSQVPGVTVAGADGTLRPVGVHVDLAGNIYVADGTNDFVKKYSPGSTAGVIVAGGHGRGAAPNQFNSPRAVFVDAPGNIYVADGQNYRVQKWLPGASEGITVAGGNGRGTADNQVSPADIFVDKDGNVFVADAGNDRIMKWAPGATTGVHIARKSDFYFPTGLWVDDSSFIYVSIAESGLVQRYVPGMINGPGAIIPGLIGNGSGANYLRAPLGIQVDPDGNLFIADALNNRIQKWSRGATEGVTVAGGNGKGSGATQLSTPNDVFVDAYGNIFVADLDNGRVQKFGNNNGPLAFKYYEGTWQSLPDFNALTPVKRGYTTNVDLNERKQGRLDNFAMLWQGFIRIPAPGTYTFETVSDDGSRLYFNTTYNASATPTVDNDGSHAAKSATGSVNVAVAGAYPVSITYFEKDGGESMQVFWSGPGIPRQLIPNTAFVKEGGLDVVDNIAPSIPVNVHVTSKGGNYINLDWDDAIDNVKVTGYDVYVDGVKKYSTAVSQLNADGLLPNNSYALTVKAIDSAGNSSGFSTAISVTTNDVTSGLNYKYYEGSWDVMPNFATLTPVKTGNSPNIDINVRTAGRSDNFAFVWEGYINIQTPGNYTFETISDDGSRFYFNSLYVPSALPTVNNDGIHAPTSATGTVNVAAAGSYPVSITYFEKDGGETMQLFWSGPGFTRQAIPASAFTNNDLSSNLTYKYYEGDWNTLPDFNTLTPVKTGSTKNIDIAVRPSTTNDHFAFTWEGHINIPAAGTYTFETVSDDGSRLFFNSLYVPGAVATVNNDGLHAAASATGSVYIAAAGSYPIAITYFEKDGGEQMQVYWSGPGISRQLIPDEAFASSTTDNIAPSAPNNLRALYRGLTYINLDWDNSTDNIGVAGYDIYVNGVKKYSCTESAFTADNLEPNASYTFTIVARDMAGNVSLVGTPLATSSNSSTIGLKYRYYEGTWTTLPNFNELTPLKVGTDNYMSLEQRNAGVNDHFGFVWEGYIKINTPGTYTFETISDDSSKLYFKSFYVPGAIPLVNNDGLHPAVSATGTVTVTQEGLYPFSVVFFDNDGDQQLQVYWSGPNFYRQQIDPAAFEQAGTIFNNTNLPTTGLTTVDDPARDRITNIYPNPFVDRFKIDFNNSSIANDIAVTVRDFNGRAVSTYHPGKLAKGNNSLSISTTGQHLTTGVYWVTLTVNGVPAKTVKLLKTNR